LLHTNCYILSNHYTPYYHIKTYKNVIKRKCIHVIMIIHSKTRIFYILSVFIFYRWSLSYRYFLYVCPYCRLRWKLTLTYEWPHWGTWPCPRIGRQPRARTLRWNGYSARTEPILMRLFSTWNSFVTFGSLSNS